MRLSVVLALIVSGCAAAPPPSGLRPFELGAIERQAVEDGVRVSLKDPGSAQFQRMIGATDASGRITVCGLVNAKNSYGGYNGASPFYGLLIVTPTSNGKSVATFAVAGLSSESTMRQIIANECRRFGLAV